MMQPLKIVIKLQKPNFILDSLEYLAQELQEAIGPEVVYQYPIQFIGRIPSFCENFVRKIFLLYNMLIFYILKYHLLLA